MSDGTSGPESGRGPGRLTRQMVRRHSLFQRMFLDNLWLKITSLCIAVALLFLVRDDKGKEADIEVQIVLSNLADGEVFVGELPRAVRVRCQDRWSRLARALERKSNPYLVDLRGFGDQAVFVFDRDKMRDDARFLGHHDDHGVRTLGQADCGTMARAQGLFDLRVVRQGQEAAGVTDAPLADDDGAVVKRVFVARDEDGEQCVRGHPGVQVDGVLGVQRQVRLAFQDDEGADSFGRQPGHGPDDFVVQRGASLPGASHEQRVLAFRL